MSSISLITGGGRSGKSSFAEKLAAEASAKRQTGVLYVATGLAIDEEMTDRIARHRAARPKDWITWERYRGFADIERELKNGGFGVILLDCIAGLLMGILFEESPNADDCTIEQFERVEALSIAEIDEICSYAKRQDNDLILVTNEIGMGVIPETRYSRLYRDALGRINIHSAKVADKVVLMVAGLPVMLK